METALASAAREEVKELIAESQFIGLMVAESVDIAINKNLPFTFVFYKTVNQRFYLGTVSR
jgi:hypothetical protein